MQYSVLLGRFFYSLIFMFAALGHFSQQTIGYAASQGVPMANVLVPISGIMAFVGGLSILLGYKSRWGAALLIAYFGSGPLSLDKDQSA